MLLQQPSEYAAAIPFVPHIVLAESLSCGHEKEVYHHGEVP